MLNVKQIPGFSSYSVTSEGRIFNMKGHEKQPHPNEKGYMVVSLRADGKAYMRKVHRLVALAFIPNPENKPQVNHINCDKTDNRVENLEWATARENLLHSYSTGLHATHAVDMLDKDGNYLRSFLSLQSAETYVGAKRPNGTGICRCLRGENRTAYGYKWRSAQPTSERTRP